MAAHLDRALLLYEQGRSDLAEQEFRAALGVDPQDARAHAFLAVCLAEREQLDEAEQEARVAVGLEPDLGLAHHAIGKVSLERGRLNEATAAAKEAIRLEPYATYHYAMLSAVRMNQRNWPGALEAAEQGLAIDPEDVQCANLRAMALVKLGRRAEAGQTIGSALARDPEDPATHANQGWTLLHEGDQERAFQHFREALRLDPNSRWAREGIVEAMKARNFIYRWMLMYFLWLSRLSMRTQTIIVIGGLLGCNMLQKVARQEPSLAVVIWPVLIAYLCFAFLTWLADPFFNLILRLDKFGRHVLSDEQRAATNWIGGTLAVVLVGLVGFLVTWAAPFAALCLVPGVLLLPLSAVFRCKSGWPRITMALVTGGVAAIGAAGLAIHFWAYYSGGELRQMAGQINVLEIGAVWGAMIGTWVSNGIFVAQPRR